MAVNCCCIFYNFLLQSITEIYKSAKIASVIANADKLFVINHFKGHEMTGFGGAMKNLAMGCASRAGKNEMHSSVRPTVKCF